MRRKFQILIFLFVYSKALFAQEIRIGLFHNSLVESFSFHCLEGNYKIFSPEGQVAEIEKGDLVFLSISDEQIRIENGSGIEGNYSSLEFTDPSLKSEFSLKVVNPSMAPRNYEGELKVDLRHGVFRLINELEFDQYLAGVVEAEGGAGAPEEFFKVQAVLCRTYAVKNWDKHLSEGFNLCDETHCQAYKGKNDENPAILHAVYSTHDIVIADYSYKLADAPYHSNSGGETQKADGLWPGGEDYLLSILDPFSKTGRNYSWEEHISRQAWTGFFLERGIELESQDSASWLIRQEHRKENFIHGKDTVSLVDIRNYFGLKSAFFDMKSQGDSLIIEGKGYGHGVGLSQEGAMEMSRQGYFYKDILRYYFHNIRIYDLNDLPFNSVPELFR